MLTLPLGRGSVSCAPAMAMSLHAMIFAVAAVAVAATFAKRAPESTGAKTVSGKGQKDVCKVERR